jgi:GMP synthase-like glutamine amidotransferase
MLVADGLIYDGLDYASRIEERLLAAGLESARRDLTRSPAEGLQPARAYVFTGGSTSVLSDASWMRSAIDTARHLIVNAAHGRYAVIGICLGSQILAEALRPGSIISAQSIEVGLTTIELAGDHQTREVVPAFHYQSISPAIAAIPRTHVEWCNAHTSVQAFKYGDRTFGYQFHPDLTVADVHSLIDYNRDLITEYRGDIAAAHRSVAYHSDALSADLFRRTVIDRT